MTALLSLGEFAFLARFLGEDEANRWAASIRQKDADWLVDVVVAYSNVAVFFDPEAADPRFVEKYLVEIASQPASTWIGRTHEVPVLYDGADLPEVAERLGLSCREVVRAHSEKTYRVSAIGFLPGFPYAGDLPDILRGLPRRSVPRPRVPAGSIAIAGKQTAIYPASSPGGWHLIGRTPLEIVDVESGFFPIKVGDSLRFVPIDADAFEGLRALLG